MSEPTEEVPVGWWLPTEAAAAWPDQSSPEDAADLTRMLQVAYEACTGYGPSVIQVDEAGVPVVDEWGDPVWVRWTEDLAVPERFREAQLLQAKAQWSFERTGGGDYIGPDGTQVRTYPMGWQVKALLRPDTGEPVIG